MILASAVALPRESVDVCMGVLGAAGKGGCSLLTYLPPSYTNTGAPGAARTTSLLVVGKGK